MYHIHDVKIHYCKDHIDVMHHIRGTEIPYLKTISALCTILVIIDFYLNRLFERQSSAVGNKHVKPYL